jgi:zinc protease
MPAQDVSLAELDAAFDAAVDGFIAAGVSAEDLERGKTRLIAEAVYAQDSQAALARWYGASLATGQTLADVRDWPARIEAVTGEAVIAAARQWLDGRRAVTGFLTHPEHKAA